MENSTDKKSKKTRFFDYYIIFYFVMACSAFIIPIDILDRSEICENFVHFMKQIFPNIEVFGSVSKIPQHTEFYVSFMWIWGLGLVAFYFWFITFIQIPIFKKEISAKTFLSAFPAIILGAMMINEYYFGLMGQKEIGFSARRFNLNFNTKFDDFWWISFFQILFAVSCWGVAVGISIIFLKIKNLNGK